MEKVLYLISEGSAIIEHTSIEEVYQDSKINKEKYFKGILEIIKQIEKTICRNKLNQETILSIGIEYYLYKNKDNISNELIDYKNINFNNVVNPIVRITILPKFMNHDLEDIIDEDELDFYLSHTFIVDYNELLEFLKNNDFYMDESLSFENIANNEIFAISATRENKLESKKSLFKIVK